MFDWMVAGMSTLMPKNMFMLVTTLHMSNVLKHIGVLTMTTTTMLNMANLVMVGSLVKAMLYKLIVMWWGVVARIANSITMHM